MRKFSVVLAALALMVGCSEDVQVPRGTAELTLELPIADVTVTQVVRDTDDRTIEAKLTVSGSERQISIVPLRGGDLPVGFIAELSDQSGILFHVSMAWDPNDPDRIWLMEQSNGDIMTVAAERIGDRLAEEYIINGDRFRVDYPALERESRRRAIAHNRDGWHPEDPAIVEFIGKYAEFEAFYGQYSNNSLHNNPDGELLVSLLANEQFAGFVVGGKDDGGPRRINERAARFCVVANLCFNFKCLVGGWVNPLCVACGGTAIACTFATVACWFVDCN
jgi:hypothetical protein